jgi:hypothetical protein
LTPRDAAGAHTPAVQARCCHWSLCTAIPLAHWMTHAPRLAPCHVIALPDDEPTIAPALAQADPGAQEQMCIVIPRCALLERCRPPPTHTNLAPSQPRRDVALAWGYLLPAAATTRAPDTRRAHRRRPQLRSRHTHPASGTSAPPPARPRPPPRAAPSHWCRHPGRSRSRAAWLQPPAAPPAQQRATCPSRSPRRHRRQTCRWPSERQPPALLAWGQQPRQASAPAGCRGSGSARPRSRSPPLGAAAPPAAGHRGAAGRQAGAACACLRGGGCWLGGRAAVWLGSAREERQPASRLSVKQAAAAHAICQRWTHAWCEGGRQ